MNFCTTCGAAIDPDVLTCPSCGADVSHLPAEPLVEKMEIESCGITFGATLLRVRNVGTAPVTVAAVVFGGKPIRITGISSGSASLNADQVTMQPGQGVTILMEQSPEAQSGNEYRVVATTSTGKQYSTTLVW